MITYLATWRMNSRVTKHCRCVCVCVHMSKENVYKLIHPDLLHPLAMHCRHYIININFLKHFLGISKTKISSLIQTVINLHSFHPAVVMSSPPTSTETPKQPGRDGFHDSQPHYRNLMVEDYTYIRYCFTEDSQLRGTPNGVFSHVELFLVTHSSTV